MSHRADHERVFNAYLAAAFAASILKSPDMPELPPDTDPRILALSENLHQITRQAADLYETIKAEKPAFKLV